MTDGPEVYWYDRRYRKDRLRDRETIVVTETTPNGKGVRYSDEDSVLKVRTFLNYVCCHSSFDCKRRREWLRTFPT